MRSKKEHDGFVDWKMIRWKEARATGESISRLDFSTPRWSAAIVPGTVLNSLVANGVYPEPYFGLNNALSSKLIPDISEVGRDFYTYWFRTEFTIPPSFAGKRVWIQLDGINYRAEIWINGQRAGTMAGMFRRGLFDITRMAAVGRKNVLALLVRPVDVPNGFITPFNPNGSDHKLGRNVTMLQPAGYNFSFPDGIRDRDTGIYKDIHLFATGPVLLRNPFVKSVLPIPDLSVAREHISVEVCNATAEPQEGLVKACISQLKVSLQKNVRLAPRETRVVEFRPEEYPGLVVKNPRLWWPIHKGEQYLHTLRLEFVQKDTVSDRLMTRFGIRDIRSDRNTPNKSRIFYVNGKRVFLHGSNWLSEDMCRMSPERTYAELRYTHQAGINFLRCWGGGATENDQFFDLCDELGIMLWIEFWQCGSTDLPTDTALYRANVEDTVKRLRNHASLAYYVSSNERSASTIIPIKDLLDRLDGTRGYQVASEVDGIHDGSPYQALNPMWYYEDTASPRGSRVYGFCPEYGCPTLPTIDCLREMMDEQDIWPINEKVWDYHDGGGFHRTDAYNSFNQLQPRPASWDAAVRQYGASDNIEDYAWKGQLYGALAYRAIWEVWNDNRFEYGDRFGTAGLFWYHNSPNRQVCGRLYDWSLEPTAALYFTQTALEPLHAQYDFLKNTVSVNNELPQAFPACTLTIRILNADMREVYHKSLALDVAADRLMPDVIRVNVPDTVSPVHFIRLDLTDADGKPRSRNLYWRSNRPYMPHRTLTGPEYEGFEALADLPTVKLQAKVVPTRRDGRLFYTVTLTNPSDNIAFMTWLRLQDARSGKPLRPAFYEDNFISLLPGESRKVVIEYLHSLPPEDVRLLIDGWNISRIEYHNGTLQQLDQTWREIASPRAGLRRRTENKSKH